MVIHCEWGGCTNDSRYPERMAGLSWVTFPKPGTELEKCMRWIKLCGRPHEEFNVKKIKTNRYVCSKHFVGGDGPTDDYPDPLPAGVVNPRVRPVRKAPKPRSAPPPPKRRRKSNKMPRGDPTPGRIRTAKWRAAKQRQPGYHQLEAAKQRLRRARRKAADQPHCRESLGMHSGKIPDSAITASSSYDVNSVGPQNARIRTEKKGGAWCPKTQIKQGVYEYIQIDLGELKVITLAETQGRFGNGQGQEFAAYYMLEYQREDHGDWKRFSDRKENSVLRGNDNTYIAEVREINPPIIARRVRFVPFSRHPRTVCMRVELYGCDWKDGIVSYQIPQGDRRGSEVNLFDFTYDGKNKDGILNSGLGQLVDLEEGISNFRLDKQGLGKKGYEWVGWKNESLDEASSKPVELIFKFDQVRNFSSASFHCNNMFSKDVRVFRMAKVFFSIGGIYFNQEPPVLFDYMKDTLIDYARRVTVPLQHRIGRYVKVQLYYEARWIMMSEVSFESEPAPGRFRPEVAPPTSPASAEVTTSVLQTKAAKMEVEVIAPKSKAKTKSVPPGTPTKATVGAVIHPEPRDRKSINEKHIGIIVGALAALVILFVAIGAFVLLRHRNQKKADASANYGSFVKQHMASADSDSEFKTMSGGTVGGTGTGGPGGGYHMYNMVATSDADFEESTSFQKLKLSELYHHEQNGELKKGKVEESELKTYPPQADMPQSPLYVKLPPEPVFQNTYSREATPPPPPPPTSSSAPGGPTHAPPPIPPPPHPTALYKVHDIVNPLALADMNGNDFGGLAASGGANGSGNGSGSGSSNSGSASQGMDRGLLPEFPRECLKFIEKIGDGDFGEIHLCDAQMETNGKKRPKASLVAVKVLRRSANSVVREQFCREAQVLYKLKDPNVAQVLGVCANSEPLCMVLEYGRHGDLYRFIRQHVPEDVSCSLDQKILSYGALIYMASQVASGMKYLESLNMVHRDLATRNCLVGHHYSIKICDLGMGRSQYTSDYYRLEGRAVMPIRWMAWESVMLGKFSSKSDVWAFAVTLWEMMTFVRQQPFSDLTDEQVIDNCSHFFKQDGLEVRLPQPANCTREIYDLMCECWNRDETLRPSFREIHMFLQRKNMGYDPKEDSHASRSTICETAMV